MEETLERAAEARGAALVLRTAGDGRLCVMTEEGAVAVGLRLATTRVGWRAGYLPVWRASRLR